MEVRQRRGNASKGSPNRRSATPESKGAKIDRGFTRCIGLSLMIVVVVVFTPLVFLSKLPDNLRRPIEDVLDSVGLEANAHVVVLDAGSTGSRVLAFTFQRDFLGGGALRLEDELWMQVKPGLSSFAENPSKAGDSIMELLNAAKDRIPKRYWHKTPITLKATAGLRLLPKSQSEAIIAEVKKVLETSGFKPEDNLIEIMNPMEEGLFAWFTVNYLLDDFTSGKSVGDSHACLDLGGGSTQIIFAPKRFPVKGIEGRKHFIHKVDILPGQPLDVYSHSYLGLGLMAAREAIFKKEISTSGSGDAKSQKVRSSCIPSASPQKFNFHGNEYEVSAAASTSFDSCLSIVNSVIEENNVHQPEELAKREVAAFSYFFDLAIEAGLISGFQGRVTVQDYVEAARKACLDKKSTFECVDLTFVTSLLTKGYGFPMAKSLSLFKKINGHEASWALGVGYQLINKSH